MIKKLFTILLKVTLVGFLPFFLFGLIMGICLGTGCISSGLISVLFGSCGWALYGFFKLFEYFYLRYAKRKEITKAWASLGIRSVLEDEERTPEERRAIWLKLGKMERMGSDEAERLLGIRKPEEK